MRLASGVDCCYRCFCYPFCLEFCMAAVPGWIATTTARIGRMQQRSLDKEKSAGWIGNDGVMLGMDSGGHDVGRRAADVREM